MTPKKLQDQGVAFFRRGNYDAARQKFEEALQGDLEDDSLAAEIYNNLGVIHKQLEDYPAAHAALDEAQKRFETIADDKGLAQTLGNRAAVYEAEGQKEEAVEAYKQSAKMLEEMGEDEMAMYAWQAVSRLRMKQGQYIAAIGAYEEGVDNMPAGSFKQKMLRKILGVPSAMLGSLSSGGSTDTDDDEEEEDEAD